MRTKTLKLFSLVLLIMALVAGCKIGPNYKRQDFNIGKTYRFSNSTDTLTFADSSWRYIFSDPVLRNLIDTALKNNFDLGMAYERINQARAAFKSTRSDVYPSLGFSGGAVYETAPNTFTGGTYEYHDFYGTANLSWELDIWGKLRRATESAKAQMFAQEAYHQSLILSLIAEVAGAYYSLLEYKDELQITLYNVEIRKQALDLVRDKLIAGTVSGLTVAQAEAELAFVQTRVPSLEMAVGTTEDALRLLLGKTPGSVTTGDTMTRQINPNIVPTSGVPSRLIFRRPDVIQAEELLISANADIGVARGAMLPTLSINAGAGYSHLGVGFIGSAIGSLVGPIFNFNKLRSNVRRAQAAHAEMLINYQKSIYSALKEVSDGLLNADKQNTIVTENKNLVAATQTAFDLSNQLFNAGYASYLDVIDAQRNLYTAQITLSQSQKDQVQSIVNLYLALGGGWK